MFFSLHYKQIEYSTIHSGENINVKRNGNGKKRKKKEKKGKKRKKEKKGKKGEKGGKKVGIRMRIGTRIGMGMKIC